MVQFEVLHPYVEGSLMASREEPVGRPVGVHCLIGLVQGSKGVSKGDPARSEVLIEAVSFLEVFPGHIVLVNEEVIGAN